MQCQIEPHCLLHRFMILLKSRFFYTAQAGRAAEPGIAAGNIIIIKFPSTGTVPRKSLKIIVQIPLMEYFIRAKVLMKPFVIQPPSNVVMAAEIIQKYVLFRQCIHRVQLSAKQIRTVFGTVPQTSIHYYKVPCTATAILLYGGPYGLETAFLLFSSFLPPSFLKSIPVFQTHYKGRLPSQTGRPYRLSSSRKNFQMPVSTAWSISKSFILSPTAMVSSLETPRNSHNLSTAFPL